MFLEIFLLYVAISTLLFFFPQIIHRNKPKKACEKLMKTKKLQVFPHRGGCWENPENSIRGLKCCLKNDFFALECDIQKTKDGEYIMLHDQNLMRITRQAVMSSEIEYKDIAPISDHIRNDYNYQDMRVKNVDLEKPPKYTDFLNHIKGTDLILMIDVKSGKDEDFKKVVQITKDMGLEEQVYIGCFQDLDYFKLDKEIDLSRVSILCSAMSGFKVIFFFLTGMLPFVKLNFDIASSFYIFPKSSGNVAFLKWSPKLTNFLHNNIVYDILMKALYFHLHRRQIPVVLWVANYEEEIRKCQWLNVKGVITDNPIQVAKYINDHSNRRD